MSGSQANTLTKTRNAKPSHVLLDASGEVGHMFAAKTTPHMFVIDKDGVLRYDGAIDSSPRGGGNVENYLADAVDAVMAGKTVATPKTKPYGCSVKYKK